MCGHARASRPYWYRKSYAHSMGNMVCGRRLLDRVDRAYDLPQFKQQRSPREQVSRLGSLHTFLIKRIISLFLLLGTLFLSSLFVVVLLPQSLRRAKLAKPGFSMLIRRGLVQKVSPSGISRLGRSERLGQCCCDISPSALKSMNINLLRGILCIIQSLQRYLFHVTRGFHR